MAAPDQLTYLDAAAGTAAAVGYKDRMTSLLELRKGHTVLDLGCGPGTDLERLVQAVAGVGGGEAGVVVGVDSDPGMLAVARRRFAGRSEVVLWSGDVHALPLADSSVDRARTDRVLQHVADPAAALREAFRVLRPGGLLAMAEPDWDTLTIADQDVAQSRAWARFMATRVRNATIGRQLPRMAVAAGFVVQAVEAVPVLFHDFDSAEQILGLRRNTARAVQAGVLADDSWLERLAGEQFLAGFTFYLIVVRKQLGGAGKLSEGADSFLS